MCGIFGLVCSKKNALSPQSVMRLTNSLFQLSESRGKEASGIGIYTDSSFQVFKEPIAGTSFVRLPQIHRHIQTATNTSPTSTPIALIGHSRIATNGTPADNDNNQPVAYGKTFVIHNGIVLNVDQLWKKHTDIKRNLLVDTELIAALYDSYRNKKLNPAQSLQGTFSEIQGEASIALFDTRNDSLLLATNTGSLYYITLPDAFIFASEGYILRQLVRIHPNILPEHSVVNHIRAQQAISLNCKTLLQRHIRLNAHPPKKYASRMKAPTVQLNGINTVQSLKHHSPDYKAIKQLVRCTKCILPATMPLIQFDEFGVCNFCHTYKKQAPIGLEALKKIFAPYRSHTGEADCIVALSGGRDSSYGLHFAKKVLGLNPIAYTYDWGMVTDAARRNQSRMCAALGVEHIWVSANIKQKRENIRKNILAWIEKPDLGMVTLLMAGDKQAEYFAEELLRKTGLKKILYCRGNQLEDERFKFGYYGIFDGTPSGVIHNLRTIDNLKMLRYYAHQFIRNPRYINASLFDTAWAYASAYLIHHDFTYLWHYVPWNEQQIVSTLKNEYGWETPQDTIATWRIDDGTPPFYNYIYYHTQGFTEHDGLRSNQIREGVITRNEALKIISEENKPRYEALAWYFNLLELNGNEILSKIDAIPPLY